MLAEWRRFGHRALVFSQTRRMLDLIENFCEQTGYVYIRMDGLTSRDHRQVLMDRFNEDSEIFLALLTTRVGGVGVNLVGADRVVIFDPDWNPTTDLQARERAWRIGQTREVCIYRLLTGGTVEEMILRRQLAKTYIADKVLKNPNLQRFVHSPDGLAEGLLLGPEYAERIPYEKRYVLAAVELAEDPTPLIHNPEDHASNNTNTHNTNTNNNTSSGGGSYREMDEINSAATCSEIPSPTPEDPPNAREKEFGHLLCVKEGVGAAGSDNVQNGTHNPSGDPLHNGNEEKEDNSETALLKRLLYGEDVEISAADPTIQRLAQIKAEQSIARLTNTENGKKKEEDEKNRMRFSLVYAAQMRSEKMKEDQREQRRFYNE
ncbi:unnamed protein product [Phytomonas sp. Hart1]|nr:unnamed protein product [Phytomonas sp. Hart1]|eukprot:CCW67896.1 unnamed protein product [Phytomonas sp. isolate Hart1]